MIRRSLDQLDIEAVSKDSDTGAAHILSGTTAQIPPSPSIGMVHAQGILEGYEAIIQYNYDLLDAGTIPTDEEYLSGMPAL